MTIWTVTRPDADHPWQIAKDGHHVDTVASHYDAWEVLAVAEQHATRSPDDITAAPMFWRLDSHGGFNSTPTSSDRTLAWDQTERLLDIAQATTQTAYDRGFTVGGGAPETAVTASDYTDALAALYDAIRALRSQP